MGPQGGRPHWIWPAAAPPQVRARSCVFDIIVFEIVIFDIPVFDILVLTSSSKFLFVFYIVNKRNRVFILASLHGDPRWGQVPGVKYILPHHQPCFRTSFVELNGIVPMMCQPHHFTTRSIVPSMSSTACKTLVS